MTLWGGSPFGKRAATTPDTPPGGGGSTPHGGGGAQRPCRQRAGHPRAERRASRQKIKTTPPRQPEKGRRGTW